MDRLLKTVCIIFLTAVSLTSVLADNGGSGYSRYGLGDIRYYSSGGAMGRGGASIGVLSTNSLNRINPAAWVKLTTTQFSIGALYEGFSTTDGTTSGFLSGTNFNGLTLAIPLSASDGITFGTGITPYSNINYHIISRESQAGLDYIITHLGEGGLSRGFVGLSGSVTKDLHLGTSFNYFFGTMRHTIRQTFDNALYTNAEDIRSVEAKGIGFTFGAVYSGLRNIFHLDSTKVLSIGFIATTTSHLTATEDHEYIFSTGNSTPRDTLTYTEGKLPLPYALGVGFSYTSNRLLIAGDVYFQQWSQLTTQGLIVSPSPRNSIRISLGGEILPKQEPFTPFSQRVAYRLGTYYDATYYRIKGEAINEIGLTGGLDIPVFNDPRYGETRLTIGIEYGFRGTTSQRLQKDKILRISFTLNGSEIWFVRPEEE